jgi:uncharacterized protein YeaO (DUF488 family)
MTIKIKRIYEEPEVGDGTRVLVDRLWARGLTKERAKVDMWLKEIAPTTELRKWFGHDPAKWIEFESLYLGELKSHGEQIQLLKHEAARGPITLLYGAKDKEHNEAVILQKVLRSS